MILYIAKRLLISIPVIFIIASLTFAFARLMPGGPFDQEKALPPAIKANIEAKYNLNLPWYKQYTLYIKNLLKGDLGPSYKYLGRTVDDIIGESFPVSLQLGLYAFALCMILGIPIGVFSAYKHNTWIDHSSMFFAIAGVALPSFLVGALLILVFAHYLGWFPAALWEGPIYAVLPAITLGTRPSAVIARLTRTSILDVIQADYIRTARAKGVSEIIVLFKHVLRNSLIPVITIAGPLFATIITGAFIVEHIFAIPGMAKHFIAAASNRDYPLIIGATLLYSVLLVSANILVDVLYAVVDPRMKLS